MKFSLTRSRWAAIGAAVAVTLGFGGIDFIGASPPDADPVVVTITPCRLMDTRPAFQVGPRGTPIGNGESTTVAVHGNNGNCAIPATALAIIANVTGVGATQETHLTFWPTGQPLPDASNINLTPGHGPVANQVTADLGGGSVNLFNFSGRTHVILDIVGYTVDHDHDGEYADVGHDHNGDYADLDHDHDADYADIGHLHDDRYLNATGDTATGTLRAPAFQFTTPKTYRYTVTESDLVPRQTTAVISRHQGQGGAWVTSAPTDDMMAGVHLPDGARVTQLVMRSFDGTASGGENITTAFLRHSPSGGFYSTIGTVATFAAGDRVVDTTNVNHIVNNSDGAYMLRVSGANQSILRFMSMEIVYEVTNL